MRAAAIFCLALLLMVAASSVADIPDKMSYQGALKDADGDPVADGTYDVTFSLYNVETGGTALWTETQSLSVEDGIVNALLGSVNPINILDFNEPYWLGIALEAEPEMSPRTPLTTVPYAARAVFVNEPSPDDDWVIDGDNMYSNVTGGVGIGDTTPEWLFDIHNPAAENTYMQFTNGATGDGGIWTGLVMGVSGGGEAWISQGSAAGIHLGHGGSYSSINIDVDGRVTVGIESVPDREMEVYGDFKTAGFAMETGAVDGYVLTCDANGVGTWQPTLAAPPRGAAGNVALDAYGEARVELPASLSGADLRYQLTCIGGFAPVYVAERAAGGVFTIAGGEPGMEVSWQVTVE